MMEETYWSRFADTYDSKQEAVVGLDLQQAIKRELSGLPALGELVELGCGTGCYTQTIVERCTDMVATDLSDSLLEAAERRMQGDPKVHFQKENCTETSFADESFDTVFMANLLHVIAEPAATIRESHRILRPDGRVVVVTFTGSGMSAWQKIRMGVRFLRTWGKPPAHTHVFSPGDIASMLGEAGFAVEQSKLLGNETKSVFVVARKS